jgi:hypothetical protein
VNHELVRLAAQADLGGPGQGPLRLAFGLACASRVRHLLEEPRAIECLAALEAFVEGRSDAPALAQARQAIAEVANSHRGSNSIDGAAHAAVSATYAVANAIAGRALDAASYAAYAAVYAYGGYAVTDSSAFAPEFEWQCEKFRQLSGVTEKP